MDDHLHGATTTGRLMASGLGTRAIRAKVKRGELLKVRREVFLHAAAEHSPQQIAAVGILAAKGRAVVTSAWAVRWHGIEVPGQHDIHLVIPEGMPAPQLEGISYRHSTYLRVLSTVQRFGLATADLAWAVGDLARDVNNYDLARVIARAVGARLITLDRLRVHLSDRAKFPGSARLRAVIDELSTDLPFSGTEKKAARALREAGMPFQLQHPLTVEGGRTIRLGDLVMPDIRLDLEVDGPHHWMPEQAAVDRRNDSQLRQGDWVVERVPVYDIDDDLEGFVSQTADLVARVTAMRRHAS